MSKRAWLPILLLMVAPATLRAQSRRPASSAARQAVIGQLEEGVLPLLVLGDVNEDGRVDAADAALVAELVKGPAPAAASCPAAADLTQDGKLDAADLAVLQRILAQGRVSAPALHAPDRLRCRFRWFALAARPAVAPGETSPIHFLDPRFTTRNSKVEVDEGKATVTPMPGGNGYVVAVAPSTAPGGYITLRITLGAKGADGRYYYTFPWGDPRARR